MEIAGRQGRPWFHDHWTTQLKKDIKKLGLKIKWSDAVKQKARIRREAAALGDYEVKKVKGRVFKEVKPKPKTISKKEMQKRKREEALRRQREQEMRELEEEKSRLRSLSYHQLSKEYLEIGVDIGLTDKQKDQLKEEDFESEEEYEEAIEALDDEIEELTKQEELIREILDEKEREEATQYKEKRVKGRTFTVVHPKPKPKPKKPTKTSEKRIFISELEINKIADNIEDPDEAIEVLTKLKDSLRAEYNKIKNPTDKQYNQYEDSKYLINEKIIELER